MSPDALVFYKTSSEQMRCYAAASCPSKADGNRLTRARGVGIAHSCKRSLLALFAGRRRGDGPACRSERRCYGQAQPALLVSGVGTCDGRLLDKCEAQVLAMLYGSSHYEENRRFPKADHVRLSAGTRPHALRNACSRHRPWKPYRVAPLGTEATVMLYIRGSAAEECQYCDDWNQATMRASR